MDITVALFILIFAVAIVIGLIPSVARAFGDEKTARKVEEKLRENRCCCHREDEDEDDWIIGPITSPAAGIGNPLWDED